MYEDYTADDWYGDADYLDSYCPEDDGDEWLHHQDDYADGEGEMPYDDWHAEAEQASDFWSGEPE